MQRSKSSVMVSIILLSIIVLGSIAVFVIPPLITTKYDEELKVYNWADYMDLSVLDSFAEYYEQVTGKSLKVVYSSFDTNETMLTEIIRGDSKIDLICPSEYAIQKLLVSDRLEKLDDWQYVSDLGQTLYNHNVMPEITESIEGIFANIEGKNATYNLNDYFVPYMWGTLGILYNNKYVTLKELEAQNYGILWNSGKNPKLDGKILVKDSIRDTYVCAVVYLKEQKRLPAKYDAMSIENLINCTDKELVDLTEIVLKEQRPHLKGYEVDFGKDDMVNEIAYVDLAWSGDAMYAIEEATDDHGNCYLDYYIPQSGSNIWFDGWVMPKENSNYTPNYRASYMFINYLCRPDISMYNNVEIGYTAGVDASLYTDMFDKDQYVDLFSAESYAKMNQILEANYADDKNYYNLTGVIYLLETYEIDNDYDTIKSFILDEYYGDLRRYPSFDDDLGMMKDFGDENERIVEMWERVKSSGEDGNWALLGIIIAALALVFFAIGAVCFVKFKVAPKPRKIS